MPPGGASSASLSQVTSRVRAAERRERQSRCDGYAVGQFAGITPARIIATDKETGKVVWETSFPDTPEVTFTSAPLAIKDKIITGIAGGEFGIRGFIDAYDPATGKRLWRFASIPGPGEFGHITA